MFYLLKGKRDLSANAQDDGGEILSPDGSRMTNWKRFYRLTAPE